MMKVLKVTAVMAVLGAAALTAASIRGGNSQADELNAATDARLHEHLQALLRGQQVEAARKQAAGIRVASR
jgi:hypothetical protein